MVSLAASRPRAPLHSPGQPTTPQYVTTKHHSYLQAWTLKSIVSFSCLLRMAWSASSHTKCPSLYLIPCISTLLICFLLSPAARLRTNSRNSTSRWKLVHLGFFFNQACLYVIEKQSFFAERCRSLKTLRLANQCGHSRRAAVRVHAAPGRREIQGEGAGRSDRK